ncbi:Uncharacterized protein YcnI [Mesorhizobium albiziae]|uniref:Uncharacterized protein YcnI n=1 Tax=Neomesorhizobium albiziae TaxID=335020 RepID=A0A1I4D3I5_9HYPH|nr:DUF1775 domain-containing protein [Mesorhizobium albiziae]GLS28328.1 nuclear export factor GLE1 [Mesorhizobium albiziae]SFK87370.1 Uncharacterized protein YcnI [Mesorhizobium albiziae]
MKMFYYGLRAILAVAAFATFPAHAHITFENKEIKAGSTVKFVLRVPHGCAGSPTTAVRIALPEELTDAKPQPKPGWSLDITRIEAQGDGSNEPGNNAHGGHDDGIIKEIAWSGGRLEDAHYDEFVFRAKVAEDVGASSIFVPIVQECQAGVERWIEIAPAGVSSDDLKFPAPSIKVLPAS